MRTSFNSTLATAVLKSSLSEDLNIDEIENSAKAMAEAFKVMLEGMGFEANETEIKRWCDYQWRRRYGGFAKTDGAKDHIKISTVLQNFRTYMGNWYDTHQKWLRADRGY